MIFPFRWIWWICASQGYKFWAISIEDRCSRCVTFDSIHTYFHGGIVLESQVHAWQWLTHWNRLKNFRIKCVVLFSADRIVVALDSWVAHLLFYLKSIFTFVISGWNRFFLLRIMGGFMIRFLFILSKKRLNRSLLIQWDLTKTVSFFVHSFHNRFVSYLSRASFDSNTFRV